MNDRLKILAGNSIENFESLEKSGDPVLLALERIWDKIEDECPSCTMKCKDKTDCPILLTLIAGINTRIKTMADPTPWVGIELDGCLSEQVKVDSNWDLNIGEPIDRMVELTKGFLDQNIKVKIFTPRVSSCNPTRVQAARSIRKWTKRNLGVPLESTSERDLYCVTIFGVGTHQVIPSRGDLLENLFTSSVEELKEARVALAKIATGFPITKQ